MYLPVSVTVTDQFFVHSERQRSMHVVLFAAIYYALILLAAKEAISVGLLNAITQFVISSLDFSVFDCIIWPESMVP